MYCWQARRRMDRDDADAALAPHLAACAGCRGRLEGMRRVADLLAEAARIEAPALAGDALDFEARVLRAARARRRAGPPALAPPPRLRPIALAAAFSLMIAAGVTALMIGLPDAPGSPGSPEPPVSADAISPREVPFTIEQDLVGSRRGRIPLTTYVLEPAPREARVVRASL